MNAVDAEGKTPLIYAASYNDDERDEIYRILVEKGADETIKDHVGRTALDYLRASDISALN